MVVGEEPGEGNVRGLHPEKHRTDRICWLRAAVLGANDGIVSTASLVVGVAAANAASGEILVAGVAGLVAGAMSTAAGEYGSVSSQSDTERADLERERRELATDTKFEHKVLAAICVERGLDAELANEVARQLMAHDALATHARDELGISDMTTARPIQAAFASAATFALGAALPIIVVLLTPRIALIPAVIASAILFLALLVGFGGPRGWRSCREGRSTSHLLRCSGDGPYGRSGGDFRSDCLIAVFRGLDRAQYFELVQIHFLRTNQVLTP
jgi:VIT1/CCC1 family predicted Fe2+/Mn2+ transporter